MDQNEVDHQNEVDDENENPQLPLSLELPENTPLNSPEGLSSITYKSNITSLSSVSLESSSPNGQPQNDVIYTSETLNIHMNDLIIKEKETHDETFIFNEVLTITDETVYTNESASPFVNNVHVNRTNSFYEWYAKIRQIINDIDLLNVSIDKRMNELKTTYSSLIQSNHKKIFLFCLDSFYFQYRVLHMEQDNLRRLFLTTKNQIYGDYFKLYGIMSMQLKDIFHVDIASLNMDVNKYTVYDDLDTLAEYTPAMVNDLFVEIDRVLQILSTHYKTQQMVRDAHLAETHIGFTITNFLNTLEYENDMIHRQWLLYRNFLENFCDSQYEYLIKLRARYKLLVNEIRNEVLHEYDDKSNR